MFYVDYIEPGQTKKAPASERAVNLIAQWSRARKFQGKIDLESM